MTKMPMIFRLMLGAATLTVGLSSGVALANGKYRDRAQMPFEAMSPSDLTRSGIRGTGCVWMRGPGGSVHFVASDDRAVVKLGGAFRRLRPTPDSTEMFPFTYSKWIGNGLVVEIARGGLLQNHSIEATPHRAVLKVKKGGAWASFSGILDCGT